MGHLRPSGGSSTLPRLRSILWGLLAGGCFPSGEGISPRTEQLYFPVGLALDETASHLYIVSSDFDLQFNAGSLRLGAQGLKVYARRSVTSPPRNRQGGNG